MEAYFELFKAYNQKVNKLERLMCLAFALSLESDSAKYRNALLSTLLDLGYSWMKFDFLTVHRIGHFALEPDVWARANLGNIDSSTLHIFVSRTNTVNEVVNSMLESKLTLLKSDFWHEYFSARPLLLSDEFYQPMQFDLQHIVRGADVIPMYKCLLATFAKNPYQFDLANEEQLLASKLLSSMGINQNDKVICFHVRDSEYLASILPNTDFSYHNFRDADISNYSEGINYLLGAGYKVVRIGKISNQKLNIKHPNYYEFCIERHAKYGELLECYLLKISKFFVGNSSGIVAISTLFDTPVLSLNMVPFVLCYAKNSMFLPKIMVKNAQSVSFQKLFQGMTIEVEVRLIDLISCLNNKVLNAAGVSFIENDRIDILDAVVEFESSFVGDVFKQKITQRQREYVNLIPDDVWFKTSNSFICDSFLHRHEHLFGSIVYPMHESWVDVGQPSDFEFVNQEMIPD